MRSVNKVILIGNATRPPELRRTQSDKPVATIRLATNRLVRGAEEAQFHSVGRLATTSLTHMCSQAWQRAAGGGQG